MQNMKTRSYTNEAKRERAIARLQRLLRQCDEDAFLVENRHRGWVWCAQQLGRPVTAIRSRAVRIGIQNKPRAAASEEKIKTLWEHGRSNTDIAERLGISTECVRKHLRELGLATNPRNETLRMRRQQRSLEVNYGVTSPSAAREAMKHSFCGSLGWTLPHPSASLTCEALRRHVSPATKHDVASQYQAMRNEYPDQAWMIPTTLNTALKWLKWLRDKGVIHENGHGNQLRRYSLINE